MTGFMVDPGRIMGFAAMVDRGFGDLKATEGYVDAIDTSGPYTGILELLQPRVDAAIQQLVWDIASAAGLMYGSTLSIDEAARWYLTTDADSAAAFDAQLPDVSLGVVPMGTPRNGTLYDDIDEPTRHLVDPPGYDEMAWKASIEDLGSAVATVREAIRTVTGSDILEPLNAFSGDWREVRRTAHRMVYVSRACDSVAVNLRQALFESTEDWIGDAGDAARYYLNDLCAGIEGLAAKADYLSRRFQELAEGAFGFFKSISDVYSEIVDLGIIVLAGAGSANPLGVGAAIIAGVRLGERINNLLDKYDDFKDFVNAVHTGLDLIRGGQLTVPDQKIAPLPPAPYDFPKP